MKIVGITGGSGAGKTTATKSFCGYGAEVLDADVLAREIVEPGKPALEEIKKEWENVVENGVLNRKALAKIVFNNEEDLHKLNTITHKYVVDEIKRRISVSKAEIFIIDAIALFESGLSELCDVTVFVTAEKETRIKRIMARDNLTRLEAEERINAQKSDDFYETRADFVILNNDGAGSHQEIIERIVKGSTP